jgi:hypothetical protein
MKKTKSTHKVGDILLMSHERLARIQEMDKKIVVLQYVNGIGTAYELRSLLLEVERNLGQSEQVLASFYVGRYIHCMMNR